MPSLGSKDSVLKSPTSPLIAQSKFKLVNLPHFEIMKHFEKYSF